MSDRTKKPDQPPRASKALAWQLQEAKARFSELVDRAVAVGPQVVTRRGEATVVVVSVAEWDDLKARARPTIKDWLLAPHARTEELVPPRRKYRRRPPPSFDD
jgi:antitoxin Phd